VLSKKKSFEKLPECPLGRPPRTSGWRVRVNSHPWQEAHCEKATLLFHQIPD